MLERKWTSNNESDNILARTMQQQAMKVVSDGSFMQKKYRFGTAGWIAEDAEGINITKGAIIVPGPAEEQCSYRSELAGIMAVLCYIADLKRKFDINFEDENKVGQFLEKLFLPSNLISPPFEKA